MRPELDIAILGSGLAANLLARQLSRQLPGTKVAMIEREAQTSFKVGEATVELFTNYMLRKLGLSTYLYETQLPKNGLRFFFDRATHDAPLEEMTEMGSQSLPYHPSFQLDRMRLEADLQRMNTAAGIDLRAGIVRDLELGTEGEPHRFKIEGAQGKTTAHTARWVIDATGRTSLIAKQKGLRVPIKEHNVASAWARYRNVTDIDDLGGPAFRERARHTPRRLSTIHFAYPGYWIWFIPLGKGVLSVGVVIEKSCERYDARILQQAGFDAFLREHAAVATLMEHAEQLDFMAYGHLAYGTTKVLSGSERWGCTGVSAAFTDPFYSPGSDFIALANDYLVDLMTRDFGGCAQQELATLGDLYDEYLLYRYRVNMLLYKDQYSTFGSFPLMRLKWDFDIQCYYDLWLHAYMQDHHLDADRLRADLRERTFVLNSVESFGQMFAAAGRHLHEKGTYFARNVGEFCEPLERVGCVKHVGLPMALAATQERILGCFRTVRRRGFELLDWPTGDAEPSFIEFVTGRAFNKPGARPAARVSAGGG